MLCDYFVLQLSKCLCRAPLAICCSVPFLREELGNRDVLPGRIAEGKWKELELGEGFSTECSRFWCGQGTVPVEWSAERGRPSSQEPWRRRPSSLQLVRHRVRRRMALVRAIRFRRGLRRRTLQQDWEALVARQADLERERGLQDGLETQQADCCCAVR